MRVVVAEHTLSTVSVLVILGVGLTIGGVVIGPLTDTEVQQRNVQTVTATHGVAATVTGNSTIYDEGTVLRDKPLYSLSAAPRATITVAVDAPSETNLTATTRLVYEVRTITQGEGKGDLIWRNITIVGHEVLSGEGSYRTAVNISSVRGSVDAVQREYGGAATVDIQLVTTVQYDTDRYEGTMTATSDIGFPTAGTYRLPPANETATEARNVKVTNTNSRQTVVAGLGHLQIGLIGGGIAALVGAVLVWLSCRRLDAEVERVRLDHARYNEFITPVSDVDCGIYSLPETDSIEALVNYAANADRQVFAVASEQAYVVLGENPVRYAPPSGLPAQVGGAAETGGGDSSDGDSDGDDPLGGDGDDGN